MKSAWWTWVWLRRAAWQGGLVDQVGQLGPDHARGGRGDRVQVDIGGQGHAADVHLQDLAAAGLVGRADGEPAVEPPRAQQGRVEDLGPVGGAEHDHVLGAGEAVHLGQDLVEGLLALVVAADAEGPAAGPADGVQLVDEDDRRGVVLGRLEQVPDAAGAHAHDELDELRGRHEVEGHVGLAGHGPGEQRLAGPGRPGQQHPLGHHGPQPPVAVGVLEEVDDLGHLVLDLVDAGHVGEGGAPAGLGLVAAGPGAAKAAEGARAPRAPGGPPGQQDEQADQQQGGAEPEQHPLQQRRSGRRFGADLDVLLGQQLPQVVVGGELGPAGAEPGHLLLLVVHGNADRVLELAVDGVLDPGDAGDVARLHLGAEQRVGHLGAFGGPDQQRRQHPVQHQQPQQHHPEPRPEQARPLRPLAAVPPSAFHPPRHPAATLGRRRSVRAFRPPGVGPAVPPVPLGVDHHRTSSSRKPRGSPRIPKGYRPHRARRRCGLRFSIRRRVLWSSARTTVVTGFCFQVGGAILAGACRWPTRRDVGCVGH